MKRLALVIAAFAAAPALAQPPASKPAKPEIAATSVDFIYDGPLPNVVIQPIAIEPPDGITEYERLTRQWEREQALYAYRVFPDDQPVLPVTAFDLDALAAETPLPPPCEPPVARTTTQPGPPRPPAPCSPVK